MSGPATTVARCRQFALVSYLQFLSTEASGSSKSRIKGTRRRVSHALFAKVTREIKVAAGWVTEGRLQRGACCFARALEEGRQGCRRRTKKKRGAKRKESFLHSTPLTMTRSSILELLFECLHMSRSIRRRRELKRRPDISFRIRARTCGNYNSNLARADIQLKSSNREFALLSNIYWS